MCLCRTWRMEGDHDMAATHLAKRICLHISPILSVNIGNSFKMNQYGIVHNFRLLLNCEKFLSLEGLLNEVIQASEGVENRKTPNKLFQKDSCVLSDRLQHIGQTICTSKHDIRS